MPNIDMRWLNLSKLGLIKILKILCQNLFLVKPLRYHDMTIENAQEEILSIEFLNELHDFFDKYGIKKGTELHKGLFDICIVYLQSHNIKF